MPGIPETVKAGDVRGHVFAECSDYSVGKLTHRVPFSSAHVEYVIICFLVVEYEEIGGNHIVDIDVVANLMPVFIDHRRLIEMKAQTENTAGT